MIFTNHLRLTSTTTSNLISRQVKAILTGPTLQTVSHGKGHRFFSSKHLIVNAVGSDRLGIVSDLTKYVTDCGGNVGESQAARLGSHFSLMMLVQVPEEKVDELTKTLQTSLADMTTSVIQLAKDDSTIYTPKPKIAYTAEFSLEGADHPGIVHRVAAILSNHGLSIQKMETSDEIAPHGGTTLFRMNGIAAVAEPLSAGFNPSKIQDELYALGDQMNCDIDLEEIRPTELVSRKVDDALNFVI